jgi:hypothetical protein
MIIILNQNKQGLSISMKGGYKLSQGDEVQANEQKAEAR